MNAHLFITTLFLLLHHYSEAQNRFTLFLNTGYSVNKAIQLDESAVEKSKAYVVDAGLTYRFFSLNKLSTEIGISSKTIFASGKLKNQSFNATTLRLSIPLKITYTLPSKKIAITSGFAFQNNVDATDFDFWLRDKYAWRLNGLFEVRYLLEKNIFLTVGFSQNLRNIPDPYFVNDPKTLCYIGFIKEFNFKTLKKKKS